MTTNVRHTFLVAVSFFDAVGVLNGYTCTYRGQGSFTCRLRVVQDVSIERPATNYNTFDYLVIAKLARYPVNRTLLQFEDL